MKLIHIITDLDLGGAETMLYRLLEHIDRARFQNQVISLIPTGVMGDKIKAMGIPVHSLGMRPGKPSLFAFLRLMNLLRKERPDFLQTWMYHADLIGGLAGFLMQIPVVWGIHNTSLDPLFVKSATIRVAHLNARLSGWLPRKIISCSETSRRVHIEIGYPAKKIFVIPNGFDLSIFKPDPTARLALRRELKLSADKLIIGLVARFDPLKDHKNFVEAAGQFFFHYPQTHFLLCGKGITWQNEPLVRWIESAGIRENCHLLGRRDDIPIVMAGLDINTLSSIGEAFPNVLAEAMACGVPSVTTDVGDAAEIVGDTGIVVPARDAQALANGWERLVKLSGQERQELGQRARERIQTHFQIGEIVQRYEKLYGQLF
jgi:glycosyltransferase involved in cell wall biosynthesis